MKLLIASLFMLTAAPAFAAETANICSYISCGTFEGTSKDREQEGISTRIEITPIGENGGKFDYSLIQDGKAIGNWPIEVTIGAEGLLTMKIRDRLYASGVCKDRICTYGMTPFKHEGMTETYGNAGILKSFDDRLELLMTFGTPSEFGTDLAVLKKQ